MSAQPTTTPARAVTALLLGAVFAGTVTAALAVLLTYAPGPGGVGLADLFRAFAVATVATFLAGLVVIAAPAWALAHRLGRRSVWDAVVLGAVLSGSAYFVFAVSTGPPGADDLEAFTGEQRTQLLRYHWTAVATFSLGIAVIGGATGALIWRLAYRRPQLAATEAIP